MCNLSMLNMNKIRYNITIEKRNHIQGHILLVRVGILFDALQE
jgi:hypothetical protein